jgi:DNA-binding NarL/FixJ family response regulator
MTVIVTNLLRHPSSLRDSGCRSQLKTVLRDGFQLYNRLTDYFLESGVRMIRDIRTFVLDRDAFVRNWITLLLARDWRTHYGGESSSVDDFVALVSGEKPYLDVILMDDVLAADEKFFRKYEASAASLPHKPITIFMGLEPNPQVLKHFSSPGIGGYLLKNEIQHSIIWAVSLAVAGDWVVTPGIQDAIYQSGIYPAGKGIVLDGRTPVASLSDREKEAARMALLFSLERHDLADELNISKDWSYGMVSAIYKKLGVDEILEGEVDPSTFLGTNELVLTHLKEIIAELHGSPKAKDIETLAFHIFTMPEIMDF